MSAPPAAIVTVAKFGGTAAAAWIIWRVVYWIGSQKITEHRLERDLDADFPKQGKGAIIYGAGQARGVGEREAGREQPGWPADV